LSPFVSHNLSESSLTDKETMDSKSTYDPEIEARRADYEKLAESLAHMAELEHNRVPELLDLDGFDVDSKNHLLNGIDDHLFSLWQNMDWHSARTLGRFYAEMRLYIDQRKLERERSRQPHMEVAKAA